MHSTVRVAVIGGGTFSYSTLYQPTNKDWSNLVQLEWAKLLFVYLWHAMGGWVNTLDNYTTRPQTRNSHSGLVRSLSGSPPYHSKCSIMLIKL